MSANVGDGAKKLGEKLLAEVEVEDLSSVLRSLRELQFEKQQIKPPTFSIPPLDILLPTSPHPPILELISPPPAHHPSGAGKTSLIYLIIAHAILPPSFPPSISLNGHNAAVILFDPLHHFSVARLASVMLNLITTAIRSTASAISDATKSETATLISRSLQHVHILRPQSWASLLATLRSVPGYLFDASRHKSSQRRVHSIVLEDVDAFVWSIRNAVSQDASAKSSSSLATASTLLTNSLTKLTAQLSCAAVLSSYSTSPRSYRPALPTSWPQNTNATRLAVRRVEVLKFVPGMSVEEAEAERAQRWSVVQKGRFECWKVGAGVSDGEGFVFRVGEKGVEVEGGEEK